MMVEVSVLSKLQIVFLKGEYWFNSMMRECKLSFQGEYRWKMMVVGESGLSTSSPVGAGTRGNGRLGGGWERGGKVEKGGGKGVGKGGKRVRKVG